MSKLVDMADARRRTSTVINISDKRAWSITLDYNTNRLVEFELDPLESFFLAVDVVSAEDTR